MAFLGQVAIIVGDAAVPTVGDQYIRDRIDAVAETQAGVFVDDSTAEELLPTNTRMVVITESVDETVVGTKWKDFNGPVLVIDAPTLFNHELSTVQAPGAPQDNQFVIEDPPSWLSLAPAIYNQTADGFDTFTRIQRAANIPPTAVLNARREGSVLDFHVFTLEAGEERL